MREQIVLAGSGGQGIQFSGQLLSRAAAHQGLEATYVPAYGAERRGGFSFCSVVVADEPIYAQLFRTPDVVLALDQRARNQYAASVRSEGLIVVNADLAAHAAPGEKARVIAMPATTLADTIYTGGGLNLVMLGAYMALTQRVSQESIQWVLSHELNKKQHLLAHNLHALEAGQRFIQESRA